MQTETLRQQGADACRAYFAEMGEDLTELCAAGHGETVTKVLTVRAIAAAAEAVGIQGAELERSGCGVLAAGAANRTGARDLSQP